MAGEVNNQSSSNNGNSPSLYALAAIVDDLKSDDTLCRLNGIAKLPTVALAIGPERTRSELLPFIKEATHDEDEILMSIAKQMRTFITYVGGIEYVEHVVLALENILAVEESICREEAIISIKELNGLMTSDQIASFVVPLIQRCFQMEWFTGRCSICGIFANTYSKLTTDDKLKESLRSIFKSICGDDTPMVRRAAANKMKEIVEVIEPQYFQETIVNPFLLLLGDDQDSVRVSVVDALPEILKKAEKENNACKEILQKELKKLFYDKSWRIRYKISDFIPVFQEMLDPELSSREILNAYENFLKDDEPEVRTSAAVRLIEFCGKIPKDLCSEIIITKILPCVKELVDDINVNVKCAVASVILDLSLFLDKSKTKEFLLPLFHLMLKDSAPDVRLNVLSSLKNINKVIGPEELSNTLLPTIIELADDSKWRVRLAVIKYIPSLASQLGVSFFDTKLTSLCLSWLTDEVFAIRDETCMIFSNLTELFGVEWAEKYVTPKLSELLEDQNYLRRLTVLFLINELLNTNFASDLAIKYLPLIYKLCVDRVPNVRFNSALCLQKVGTKLGKGNDIVETEIKEKLRELVADPDKDVQDFAYSALETINASVENSPMYQSA